MAKRTLGQALLPSGPQATAFAFTPTVATGKTPINVIDSFPVLTEEVGYRLRLWRGLQECQPQFPGRLHWGRSP